MNRWIVNHPSAWLPIAMSLAAIGVLLVHVALFGTARQADEGPPPTSGRSSWRHKFRSWPSSPSNGCRARHARRCSSW